MGGNYNRLIISTGGGGGGGRDGGNIFPIVTSVAPLINRYHYRTGLLA